MVRTGYQWTISGSDSGTNPQYLSLELNTVANLIPAYPPDTVYPTGHYAMRSIQSQPQQYYGAGSIPVGFNGSREYDGEEYYEEEKPIPSPGGGNTSKRTKSSSEYKKGRRDGQHHHNDHSRYCHHRHHRSKSQEDGNRERETDREDYHVAPKEKVRSGCIDRCTIIDVVGKSSAGRNGCIIMVDD